MTDFQMLSSSNGMLDAPWTNINSGWTPISSPPGLASFDPQKVPSSIKNCEFINISNVTGFDPWMAPQIVSVMDRSKLQQQPSPKLINHIAPINPIKRSSEDYTHNQISQQFAELQIQQQQQQQQQSDDPEGDEEISGQSRYKTELCRSFAETGVCRYGFKCQFAHGRDELRPVMRHPKYKTETCKTFHTVGSCPYGSRCRFIHAKPGVPANQEHILNFSANSLSPPQTVPRETQQQLLSSPPSMQPLSKSTPDMKPPTAVTWSDSWGPDEANMHNSKSMRLQNKPKEDEVNNSKRRLQIFRTICSTNPSWE
ncbi:hypothetical protein SAMD00019534_035980 [Acytostelium subglobosum LB1]|uniref:hypothetical protein n=1 Tax=Acytostelium subglobosum LB1 TaxID=1410327 RepID=UPI0006450A09|nr:hypothetical protein SAMD00019534_035980 [Acytostelium subglobosum LB1]GAM20423.1 hypothetical protein SAMD00019534_035980 [Acytostelium subglobosum LB1]|eukprot:XP_012759944.1 hypothetical protein SAMD00019534_035980 [Acytostelium subglobosum LB1]